MKRPTAPPPLRLIPSWVPPERAIHLVDIENLVGTSTVCPDHVALVRDAYDAIVGLAPTDHVVIASGSCAAPAVWLGWGPARRLVRRGLDGADRCLLEVLEFEQVAIRYERVVVASGDGIFAEACAHLVTLGCAVTVVSRPEALSARLRLAVRDVRFLRLLPNAPTAAGLLRRVA